MDGWTETQRWVEGRFGGGMKVGHVGSCMWRWMARRMGRQAGGGVEWVHLGPERQRHLTMGTHRHGVRGLGGWLSGPGQTMAGPTAGHPFDPTVPFSCATANVICHILFGERFDYQDSQYRHVLRVLSDSFRLESSVAGQVKASCRWACPFTAPCLVFLL